MNAEMNLRDRASIRISCEAQRPFLNELRSAWLCVACNVRAFLNPTPIPGRLYQLGDLSEFPVVVVKVQKERGLVIYQPSETNRPMILSISRFNLIYRRLPKTTPVLKAGEAQ